MDYYNYDNNQTAAQDWDIFWTDASVLPERIAKMKPY